MQIRVYYEDTDCMGIVYHTNYLKFCERARSELFFANGGDKFLQENVFVLRELRAFYKFPAKLGDILTIKNTVESLDKYCLNLKQEIFKDDVLLFEAYVKLVHIKDLKLAKIDDELRAFIEKQANN